MKESKSRWDWELGSGYRFALVPRRRKLLLSPARESSRPPAPAKEHHTARYRSHCEYQGGDDASLHGYFHFQPISCSFYQVVSGIGPIYLDDPRDRKVPGLLIGR